MVNAANALKTYLEDTRRPVYSLWLVLPFLLAYEIGLRVLPPGPINGGDWIIRKILNSLTAMHLSFASVLVLAACFLAWQYKSRASWKVEAGNLQLLFLESFVLALVLFGFMTWISRSVPLAAGAGTGGGRLVELILYCGAGVYEELVFRVLLVGLLMLVLTKLFHLEPAHAAAGAVIAGALLFSLFHYGPGGDAFRFNTFVQRAFAGVFFSAVFVTRSFGVVAACHALYDILVGLRQMTYGP